MPKKQTEPKKTVTVEVLLSGRKLGHVGATVEVPIEDLNLGERVTTNDLAAAARSKIVDEATIEGKAVFELKDSGPDGDGAVKFRDTMEDLEYEIDDTEQYDLFRGAREMLDQLITKVKVTNGREALAELKTLRAAAEAACIST